MLFKVPVENMIGKDGKGFQCLMANFNHERWMICVNTNRFSRLMTEEAFKWANQRIVFNKPLIDQPVIRNKLAMMIGQTEAVQVGAFRCFCQKTKSCLFALYYLTFFQNWIENVTFQVEPDNSVLACSLGNPTPLFPFSR